MICGQFILTIPGAPDNVVQVDFEKPARRPGGEARRAPQATGFDTAGDQYVYDRPGKLRVTYRRAFPGVSSAVLASLLDFADAASGRAFPGAGNLTFAWKEYDARGALVATHAAVRLVGELEYEQDSPGRYTVELSLEEDLPWAPPPAPASFAAALAAKYDVCRVWILKFSLNGADYYLSDAAVEIEGWDGGVTTLPWVSQWGEITEQLTGSLGEIRRSDFSLSCLVDDTAEVNIKTLAEANDLESAAVSLFLWFLGLDAATDPPREYFRGHPREVDFPDDFTAQLVLEDETSKMEGLVGRIATPELFPAMLTNHAGRMVPLVLGQATNVMPPCVMVDASNWYYQFDHPLTSIDAVFRKNSDGTVTNITATAVKYLGTPDNSNYRFPGKAVIVQPKQAAVVTPGTDKANVTVRALDEIGAGPTRGGTWSGFPGGYQATDASDSTYTACTGAASPTFLQLRMPVSVAGVTRVKARVKVFSTQPFTVEIFNQSSALIGSCSFAAVSDGTVVDTGWFDVSGSLTLGYVKATFPNLGGQNYYVYAGWLDVEYTVSNSATSYVANSADILVTATRMVGSYTRTGIVYRPIAVGTISTGAITNQANMYDADPATYGNFIPNVVSTNANGSWSRTFLTSVPGLARRLRACLKFTATTPAATSAQITLSATIGSTTLNTQFFWGSATAETAYTVTGITIRSPWLAVLSGATAATLAVNIDANVTDCKIYDLYWELEASDSLCAIQPASDFLLDWESATTTGDVQRVDLSSPAITYTSASGVNMANCYDGDPATYGTLTYSGVSAFARFAQKFPALDGISGWVRLAILADKALAYLPYCSAGQSSGGGLDTAAFTAGQPQYSRWVPLSDVYTDRGTWTLSAYVTSGSTKIYDMYLEFCAPTPDASPQTDFSGPVLPAYYQVNGALTTQRRLIDNLHRLAFENRAFFRHSLGVPTLLHRPDSLVSAVTIAACRSVDGRKVYSRRRAAINDVINTIDLRYDRDYSVGDGPEAYAKVASAADPASVATFGPLSQPDLFCFNHCTDPNLAADVLGFYVDKYAPRYWEHTFETYLDYLGVEFGAVVTLGFLPDAPVGVVVSVGIMPGNGAEMDRIKFIVRT